MIDRRSVLKAFSLLPIVRLLVPRSVLASPERVKTRQLHIWYSETEFAISHDADEAANYLRLNCGWTSFEDMNDDNEGSKPEHWTQWPDDHAFTFTEPVEDLAAMEISKPEGPTFDGFAPAGTADEFSCFYESHVVPRPVNAPDDFSPISVNVTRTMAPTRWIEYFGPGHFGSTEWN